MSRFGNTLALWCGNFVCLSLLFCMPLTAGSGEKEATPPPARISRIKLIAVPSSVVYSHNPSVAELIKWGIALPIKTQDIEHIRQCLSSGTFTPSGVPNSDCRVVLAYTSNGKRAEMMIDRTYSFFVTDKRKLEFTAQCDPDLKSTIKSIIDANKYFIEVKYDQKTFKE